MALKEILIWPDPRLKQKAKPVGAVDAKIRKLCDDMAETMYEANGVGLAATLVGGFAGGMVARAYPLATSLWIGGIVQAVANLAFSWQAMRGHDIAWLTAACIYAHVGAGLADSAAAAVLYRALEPFSEQVAFPAFGVWGPVGLYLGSLALVLGDPAGAEHHLQQAARIAIRAGAPIWEARAVSQLRLPAGPAR